MSKGAGVSAASKEEIAQKNLLYEAQFQAASLCPYPAKQAGSHDTACRHRSAAGGLSITMANGQQLLMRSARSNSHRISAKPATPKEHDLHYLQDILAQPSPSAVVSGGSPAQKPGVGRLLLAVQHALSSRKKADQNNSIGLPYTGSGIGAAVLEMLQAIAQDSKMVSGVTAVLARSSFSGPGLHGQNSSVSEEALRGLLRVACLELPATDWNVLDAATSSAIQPLQVSLQ